MAGVYHSPSRTRIARLPSLQKCLLAAFSLVLRVPGEHLDDVVMEAVVELALEGPSELRVFDVARVKLKLVSVHAKGALLEVNGKLDGLASEPGTELEQRMLVLDQLGLDPR